MWIVFIIVLCVALAVSTLRPTQAAQGQRRYRQEPTINIASLPDVGQDGPPLARGSSAGDGSHPALAPRYSRRT